MLNPFNRPTPPEDTVASLNSNGFRRRPRGKRLQTPPQMLVDRAVNPVPKPPLIGLLAILSIVAGLHSAPADRSQPLALLSDNPHYFQFRGKPTVLITSGEHYGAVLNLDFDYIKYLKALAADGLNLTRTFSGAYAEPYGAFNISSNTLAPAPGRFICPWRRSDVPGYANGGNKFDLSRWDEAYFTRLKDFVARADKRGVVVEMNLFCPMYDESQWKLSPQNSLNNINGVGEVARTNVYALDRNGGLLAVQETMTRKIVTELNGFENVYYEICNEPYFGGVTMEWQRRMADVIVETERTLSNHHLISQNVANDKARVQDPHPALSIFNFHYASPPDTVGMNFGLNKVIGDNETGFRGTNDLPYRAEAWSFILAGGGLFNHLDYSFTAGHEDGTYVYGAKQPGGGNPAFRRQMKVLKEFINSFDFKEMKPLGPDAMARVEGGARVYVLAEPGKAYAIYLAPGDKTAAPHKAVVSLELPPGSYRATWVDPLTGDIERRETVRSEKGPVVLKSPPYREDVALKLIRK